MSDYSSVTAVYQRLIVRIPDYSWTKGSNFQMGNEQFQYAMQVYHQGVAPQQKIEFESRPCPPGWTRTASATRKSKYLARYDHLADIIEMFCTGYINLRQKVVLDIPCDRKLPCLWQRLLECPGVLQNIQNEWLWCFSRLIPCQLHNFCWLVAILWSAIKSF